jgi:hypothetical protein
MKTTFTTRQEMLAWATRTYDQPSSNALEFGVQTGSTLQIIRNNFTGNVYGFDSFQGLPENWTPQFPKGSFPTHQIPNIPGTELIIGLFQNTLQPFLKQHPQPISVIHLDADLYSSTIYALQHTTRHLTNPAILIFDEWHNYPQCEQHEQRAFHEWITTQPQLTHRTVADVDGQHPQNNQQIAIEIRKARP